MNPKALATLAIVSACQPISVYPQTQSMTVIDTYSYGLPSSPLSSVTLFADGNCEQVVFDNQLSGVSDVVAVNLGGHEVLITANSTEPDVMSISPTAGYYVDGPDEISVEDGDIGTIVVCLEAMS